VPIDVEINLRIPRLTIRSASAPDKVIDNSVVRFTRLAQVPAIPKAGEPLQLAARVEGDAIDCVVTRADWSEDKELFIVSCNYSKKSIAAADYEALVNDADWTMKPLIASEGGQPDRQALGQPEAIGGIVRSPIVECRRWLLTGPGSASRRGWIVRPD
jgi:hypothetical protein